MPQTLLALLALVLSSLLVFNQQRLTTKAQTRMVNDEMELAASGLASNILEFADGRSFDEATSPRAIDLARAVPASAALFSGVSTFGAVDRGTIGCNLLTPGLTPDCDDVDDLDGISNQSVSILLANGRSLPFEISLAVSYVNGPASAVVSLVPTLHKRVTLRLSSRFVNRGQTNVLETTRVVSFDPIKAAKDHEDLYGPIDL